MSTTDDVECSPAAIGHTVSEAMIRFLKLADPEMTVAQAGNALSNDHVHARGPAPSGRARRGGVAG